MVQIGNFHIGKAETAQDPTLSFGEAHILWNHLIARYDAIKKTQFYANFIHDPEFKKLALNALATTLEKQVNVIEDLLNKFAIPLPPRPPKSVKLKAGRNIMDDEYMFRDIFISIENFINIEVYSVRTFITNDPLRAMFIKVLKEELDIYDNMCKYGKLKGWLRTPPMHAPQA